MNNILKKFEIVEINTSLLKKEKFFKATKANAKSLLIFYIKHIGKKYASYSEFWNSNHWGFWGKPDIFDAFDDIEYEVEFARREYYFDKDKNNSYQIKITLENKHFFYDVRNFWDKIIGTPLFIEKETDKDDNQQALL